MASVQLINVNKVYDGGVHAVHDFSIDIKDKEFIVFVGPSGCGKIDHAENDSGARRNFLRRLFD